MAVGAPRTPAWARLSSVLVLLAFASAQLYVALHFALVRHSVCREHAQLVHEVGVERGQGASAVAAASTGGVESPDAEHLTGGPRNADAEHEHCTLPPGASAGAALLAEPSFTGRDLPDCAGTAALGPHPAALSIALLALAPKQSPPRTWV